MSRLHRLAYLHLVSRRAATALGATVAYAIVLRIALHWHWNTYGALQMPLVVEAACAAAIVITTASPFGEPERATGRWLPYLRFATTVGLTAAAGAVLAAATIGLPLAGGTVSLLRNIIGLIGIGLLCAAVVGGSLAWTGPITFLIVGVYGLYTQWHGPALTTPWIWPSRPGDDLGAALCAGLVFLAGIAVITVRGAPDSR
jgi:hypothetical protein